MATTTLTAIINDIVAVIAGLTPTDESDRLFNHEPALYAPREWFAQHPDAFRIFAVRDLAETEQGLAITPNLTGERERVEILIAYTRNYRGGDDAALEALIRADREQVDDAVGTLDLDLDNGVTQTVSRTVVPLESDTGRGGRLSVIELDVDLYRTPN